MYLSSLKLKNFRNIKETELQFNPKVNIILGQNGQGKTNLLEAIYFLGIARSFRTSHDAALIAWEGDGFFLSGITVKQHIQDKIDIILEGTKRVRINNKFLPRIIDLIGHFFVSVFFPEDLHLIKGTPDLRRRFLDILLSQSNPQYIYHLQQYQRILKQRNELLWQLKIGVNTTPVDMLSVWDTQMQSAASQIIKARGEAVRNIEGIASGIHQQITTSDETFKMSYKPSTFIPDKRSNEIKRGCTLSGPHLDDILFQINGVEARHGSSQGQQRTAAISLRLAEMECLHQQTEELPVLLLDDICSELDESRRKYLMKAINRGGQIFITTTELGTVKELMDGATVFEVRDGAIGIA